MRAWTGTCSSLRYSPTHSPPRRSPRCSHATAHHGAPTPLFPQVLADSHGAVEAHQRLGDLASEIGDMQSAGAHFESALSITTAQPDAQKQLNATKIDIGLAQGGMEFSEFLLTQMATSA